VNASASEVVELVGRFEVVVVDDLPHRTEFGEILGVLVVGERFGSLVGRLNWLVCER